MDRVGRAQRALLQGPRK